MAKENGAPTATDKGKGKIEDDKGANSSKKSDESKKDKDGKPIANGKKGEEPQDGMSCISRVWQQCTDFSLYLEELNEEDQQLKNELEMLVSRLKAWVSMMRIPLNILLMEVLG